jgi:hypothetical protein
MNSTEQKDRRPAAEVAKPLAKRPYVKPQVRHERVFETQALSCGKVGPTEFSCRVNRKNS